MTWLQARYGGRYRYHWSRLLAFAALDAGASVLRLARGRSPAVGATAPRRILVIRVDGIGDVIAMLPALDALRAGFPSAEIDLLTSPPCAQLLEGDRRVDRVMATRFLFDDAERGRNRAAPALGSWLPTVGELRARRYDLAIDFRGDFRTILWLAWASGAPRRLSWLNVSAGQPLLTEGVEGPGRLHEVEAGLRLVSALGLPPVRRTPHLDLPPASAARGEEILRAAGLPPGQPRVGFHCFAISPLRTWPPERFAAVIDRLARETGARGVLLGAGAEKAAADALLARTRSRPVSLVGRTTLKDLAAVLSRLDLVVCLDSGILHLAAAVGTPTVSLFGPGDPARWRPLAGDHTVLFRGLPCSPCRDIRCIHPTNRCLQEIQVDDVVRAARGHLSLGVGCWVLGVGAGGDAAPCSAPNTQYPTPNTQHPIP